MKKLHWTQTAEGKKRMRAINRKTWKQRRAAAIGLQPVEAEKRKLEKTWREMADPNAKLVKLIAKLLRLLPDDNLVELVKK